MVVARRRSSMQYGWWGIAALIAVFAVFGFLRLGSGGAGGEELAPLPIDRVDAQDWVKGNADAPAVLIEFGDFQCPACRAYSAVLNEIEQEFGSDLAIVYRHFPLRRIHLNAESAARAAEAAGRQGTFWEMHDMLFARQSEWSRGNPTDLFRSYAEQLGLDLAAFEQDMDSEEVREEIRRDERNAIQSGAQGTPTFILNGKRIATPASFDEFRFMVQGAIVNKAGSVGETTEGGGGELSGDAGNGEPDEEN